MHGGLHYGKVLERAGNYFGSAINLASRIAGKALPGSFWCSDDFVAALKHIPGCNFITKGNHAFKNIAEEKEVFEIGIESINTNHVDPVCRMLIVNHQNAIHHPHDEGVYFCSSHCLEIYGENEKFAMPV